jgi:hypothetical protein
MLIRGGQNCLVQKIKLTLIPHKELRAPGFVWSVKETQQEFLEMVFAFVSIAGLFV